MNILDKIMQEKIESIKKMSPLVLKPRTTISLVNQFKGRFIGVIGEIKKGSPSKGIFSDSIHLESLVNHYNKGACAISVLTDEKFFHGGFDVLKKVRSMTTLPLLCKDFIMSTIQIDYAYHAGADAILLIKKILDLETFELLLDHAKNLGMDVLVEIDTFEDFQSIEHLNFQLCGINNRNLCDFSIDFSITLKLAPYIRATGRIVISESGISRRQDILKLRGDIDGCLIGESLIRNPSLLNNLRVYKDRIKVKICGIKSKVDAQAIDGKADYIGLVLCDSKRKLSLDQAISIRSVIKNSNVVGVFNHQSCDFIENCDKTLKLDYVQVHDDVKLLSIEQKRIIRGISYNKVPFSKALYLVDNIIPGSGRTFNINNLKYFNTNPYILAGGLKISNVKDRILNSNCFCVDVSSGVEKDGVKSRRLMLDFIERVGDL